MKKSGQAVVRGAIASGASRSTPISSVESGNMNLGELRWPDIDATTDRVLIVPIASLEQHGRHLPLLSDTMIGQAVINKITPEIADIAVFLPMLWLGASDHHLAFPGTVSIPQDTYVKVLEGIVESAIMAGYRKILLLNSHAGNLVPAQLALTNIQLQYKDAIPDLFLALTSWFDIAGKDIASLDGVVQPSVSHACEWETSIMLTAHPDLVVMTQAAGAHIDFSSRYFQPDYRAPQRVFVARTMDQGTTTGAYGHCELASAEKGDAILCAAATVLVDFVREFHGWPLVTPQPEA